MSITNQRLSVVGRYSISDSVGSELLTISDYIIADVFQVLCFNECSMKINQQGLVLGNLTILPCLTLTFKI